LGWRSWMANKKNHGSSDTIPSGKHTKNYWKWPSRNSGFSHCTWCIFP
jgi:hypothetical protein